MDVAGSPDPREESQAQRDDRNLAELLQEPRVAGLGVQVLFGLPARAPPLMPAGPIPIAGQDFAGSDQQEAPLPGPAHVRAAARRVRAAELKPDFAV